MIVMLLLKIFPSTVGTDLPAVDQTLHTGQTLYCSLSQGQLLLSRLGGVFRKFI